MHYARIKSQFAAMPVVSMQDAAGGAIKSEAGVHGLPCEGMRRQGKPCTPSVILNSAQFVSITFNRTLWQRED